MITVELALSDVKLLDSDNRILIFTCEKCGWKHEYKWWSMGHDGNHSMSVIAIHISDCLRGAKSRGLGQTAYDLGNG